MNPTSATPMLSDQINETQHADADADLEGGRLHGADAGLYGGKSIKAANDC
jgi:hypothetical protein